MVFASRTNYPYERDTSQNQLQNIVFSCHLVHCLLNGYVFRYGERQGRKGGREQPILRCRWPAK